MLSIVMPIIILHPVVERMTIQSVDSVYKNTLGEWELIMVVHGGPNFGFMLEHPRITGTPKDKGNLSRRPVGNFRSL